MKKKAFTLAEVLVTLMVIGVVAALIMPSFLGEIQKNRWTVTFKKTFAETFNALGAIALDEDCSKSLTCTHIFDGSMGNSTQMFGEAFSKLLATNRVCGFEEMATDDATEVGTTGCFSHRVRNGLNSSSVPKTILQAMTGSASFSSNKPFYTFVTQRGVSYALFSFGTQCLNEASEDDRNAWYNAYVFQPSAGSSNQMLSLCGFIILDVNGSQSPNVWGRDVFGIWITDRSVLGVYPFGGDYDKRFGPNGDSECGGLCCRDDGTDSRGCASRIIKDGWTMRY